MRRLLFCLFAFVAGPALADTTAVYETPNKLFKMTLEIADDGDLRGTVAAKPDVYFLTLDGQGYVVLQTSAGPTVERIEDVAEALKVVMLERSPEFKGLLEQVGKDKTATAGPSFAKAELTTVQGRTGTAYRYKPSSADGPPPPVVLVISDDPTLAPLGRAMAGQFAMSDKLQPIKIGSFNAEVMAILVDGAPLMVAGAELTTVSHDPIAPDRFALPGPIATREAVIERIRARAVGKSVTAF